MLSTPQPLSTFHPLFSSHPLAAPRRRQSRLRVSLVTLDAAIGSRAHSADVAVVIPVHSVPLPGPVLAGLGGLVRHELSSMFRELRLDDLRRPEQRPPLTCNTVRYSYRWGLLLKLLIKQWYYLTQMKQPNKDYTN